MESGGGMEKNDSTSGFAGTGRKEGEDGGREGVL